MNNFQTILVAIFLAFFVFGVLIFSGVIKIGGGNNSSTLSGNVIIWGTLPSDQVSSSFGNMSDSGTGLSVRYIEQDEATYEKNLIEAFANDAGPDLFILTPDMVLENNNFIYKIPYNNLPEKTFKTSFIDGADIYLAKDGIIGYPLLVDPLVIYYNKNIISNEGMVYPPTSWDKLFDLSSSLTKKKVDGTISQSMIAFGQYDNINNVKGIISMLLFQSNNPIVARNDTGYRLAIKDSYKNISPINQIMDFFLEFSNPSKEVYSWNRSMPNSFDMFTSGKLAFYVGYASELFNIESVNPNLSFDVSIVPQTEGTNIKRTSANMYTIVVNKKSKNLTSALSVSAATTASPFLKDLSIATSLPTATRSLLNEKPKDPYMQTFFESAVISRAWLDPNKEKTDSIFKELIENSLSNKLSVGGAIDKAFNQLSLLLSNTYE